MAQARRVARAQCQALETLSQALRGRFLGSEGIRALLNASTASVASRAMVFFGPHLAVDAFQRAGAWVDIPVSALNA